MFAILLETGAETGPYMPSDARPRFLPCGCRWATARASIPMKFGLNLGWHGFAHLGIISNNKEWRFFGGQKVFRA
jgi:hypothetical protein